MQNFIETEALCDGRLQMLYLNRPDSYNSLSPQMLGEILQMLEFWEQDENVRCIGISGRGKAFCAGQNLKDFSQISDQNTQTAYNIVTEFYNPLVEKITQLSKPVVALVNGPAVGAGAMLALVCDFAFAKESAGFSFAFANIGLIPDTAGTYLLPKIVGRQQAQYLAFTGKNISAKKAAELGLVAEVFADDNFEAESLKILGSLAGAATTAIGLTKKAFAEAEHKTLSETLQLEAELQQKASETEDFKEGVAAFIGKRKPNFKGI